MKISAKNTFNLLNICAFVLVISSCKKLIPEAQIPAYIQIDSFSYESNLLIDTSGSKSHKIENVWVYADNIFLGVYVLPAKIPVLKTGNVKIELRPGIKQNGITNTRVSYPFYETYTANYNLEKGQTIKVIPNTKYFDFINVAFNEFFESNAAKLEKLEEGKGVNIIRANLGMNEIFEGANSGEISLVGNDTVCSIASKSRFKLPIAGKPVYLELDYKCKNQFLFGIVSYTSSRKIQQQIFTFNPSYNQDGVLVWKKIYIDMSPEVSLNSDALDYKIFFYASKKKSDAEQHIFLDNIKVLY